MVAFLAPIVVFALGYALCFPDESERVIRVLTTILMTSTP